MPHGEGLLEQRAAGVDFKGGISICYNVDQVGTALLCGGTETDQERISSEGARVTYCRQGMMYNSSLKWEIPFVRELSIY